MSIIRRVRSAALTIGIVYVMGCGVAAVLRGSGLI